MHVHFEEKQILTAVHPFHPVHPINVKRSLLTSYLLSGGQFSVQHTYGCGSGRLSVCDTTMSQAEQVCILCVLNVQFI